jgi:class 3 adenylate cyclase
MRADATDLDRQYQWQVCCIRSDAPLLLAGPGDPQGDQRQYRLAVEAWPRRQRGVRFATEVSMQDQQRRLAAILVADIVGFSRMMERDELGTFQRLRALREDVVAPTVSAHAGRIISDSAVGQEKANA